MGASITSPFPGDSSAVGPGSVSTFEAGAEILDSWFREFSAEDSGAVSTFEAGADNWRDLRSEDFSVPVPSPVEGERKKYQIKPVEGELSAVKRGRGRPPKPRGETPDSVIHARKYTAPNWYTPAGVSAKRREIEKKGMPDLKNWRFITLTLNRDLFEGDPVVGYEAGKEQLRRFLEAGRVAGLWPRGVAWCWKLEFQADGWAHWHLLLGRTEKFSELELKTVSKIWGLGRCNVERVDSNGFDYSFKYVFKGVYQRDDEEKPWDGSPVYALPDWFLNYRGTEETKVSWVNADGFAESETVEKPKTYARHRFWQASRNFYVDTPPPKQPSAVPTCSIVPFTAGENLEISERKISVIARESFTGRYVKSAVVVLLCTFAAFANLAGWHWSQGGAVCLSVNSFVVPSLLVKQRTENIQKWKFKEILRQSGLSLREAFRLQSQGQTLRT